jgi:cell division protein FtsL
MKIKIILMRQDSVYNSKNILILVIVFIIIFSLLYGLGSFFHESRKINNEIESIRQENIKARAEINQKKEYLEYLKTKERIDKEAKMQMGKKLPGEQVLVFIEEKLDIIPSDFSRKISNNPRITSIPIIEKWKWLFFGER